MLKGKKLGETIGEARGKKLEKRETAKKLKRLNVDIEIIVQSTGLTKEEIEKF